MVFMLLNRNQLTQFVFLMSCLLTFHMIEACHKEPSSSLSQRDNDERLAKKAIIDDLLEEDLLRDREITPQTMSLITSVLDSIPVPTPHDRVQFLYTFVNSPKEDLYTCLCTLYFGDIEDTPSSVDKLFATDCPYNYFDPNNFILGLSPKECKFFKQIIKERSEEAGEVSGEVLQSHFIGHTAFGFDPDSKDAPSVIRRTISFPWRAKELTLKAKL